MTDMTKPKRKRHIALRILTWIGVTLLALIVCLIIFVAFFAAGVIKHVAGEKGSAATGRSFAIEGPIKFHWDWTTPSVHIEGIKLGNGEGFRDPQMVDIGSLDFSIRIWHLLYGQLNFPELKITKAKIALEKRDDDHKNWDLPTMSKANAASQAAVPKSRFSVPVIGLLTLQDSELIYRDDKKKLNLDLSLNTASGSASGTDKHAEQGVKIDGHGTLQDKTFVLEANGGSVAMLRDSKDPFPLKIHLQMGATVIDVDGTFKDPVKMEGIDTRLSIKGDNLADLYYLTAIPLPPTPKYSISGTLKNGKDLWEYQDFKGQVGSSDLAGNLKYDTSGKRGFATIDLVSNRLDMKDLAGFVGKAPKSKTAQLSAEQKREAAKQAASDRVLPDVKIDLSRLRATDLAVNFDAKKLIQPGLPVESLKAKLNLKDGLLKIDPLDLGIASGHIVGSLTLDGRQSVPDVGTDIVLKQLSLRDFFKGSRFAAMAGGKFGGRVAITGKGKSLAEVLGNSNGGVALTMAGGRISLLLVKAAGLDLGNAAPLYLGRDETTNIRCFVGDFVVKNGFWKSRVFDFDTQDSNIYGYAGIDMKTEGLDIGVKAHPKSPSVLDPIAPITVTGTMKHPAVGIGLAEAGARTAAATALAFVAPVAAILPFIQLGLGKNSDCRDLIANAQSHGVQASDRAADTTDKN